LWIKNYFFAIDITLVLALKFLVSKAGFKSESRGGFSQLPKMSAEKTILEFRK
jgi:hypothetical protein